MKKFLFLFPLVMLLALSAIAQEKNENQEINNKKLSISLMAGPSFPIGSFSSQNTNNSDAGFAKTGYNLNLQFVYRINPDVIIASTILYSRYSLYNSVFNQLGVSADHWQYYGLLIGAMYEIPIGKKGYTGIKAMFGPANVNSPAFTYNNNVIIKEDWSVAFAMQFGMDYRYSINKKLFLIINSDYSAMKPKLEVTPANGSPSKSSEQPIGVIDLTAGIGMNF